MVAASFLQSRQIMFEVDKHLNNHGNDVAVNTSFNYTLLDQISSDDKYFIEVDWKFKISTFSGAVLMSKVSSYMYMVRKIFRGYSTSALDIEVVVDDSFRRFEEEFAAEKEGTDYAGMQISEYDKVRVTERIESFIQKDLGRKKSVLV